MRRADFESMIRAMSREVPPEFLDGVEAIEVTGKTIPHPLREGVFTLGECVPRDYGPGEHGHELRSTVLLHHGSFAELARTTEGFDWRHEAWETLTHELRHHLEWRARVGDLEALDDAVAANYARHDGEPFAPLFFLGGERVEEGVYKVEDDVFFDLQVGGREPGAARRVVSWHGRRFGVAVPALAADILFLTLVGLSPGPAGDVVLVIRRRPGAWNLWHRAVVAHAPASVTPAP